jgi:Holliday junction resolvase-like predicted endonuclease
MQLHNPEELQSLISEYGKMKAFDGYSAQTRGQALNELIAKMFTCWGLEAESNVRHKNGKGETDTITTINSKHYIIEVKWEQKKTDTGDIAKLQKRVRQRIEGTTGIFISIAGYSPEAIADLTDGERLSIICLDETHLEAMLSGFVPPEEMITKLLKKASLEGIAYSAIENLHRNNPSTTNEIKFTTPPELKPVIEAAPTNFDLETVLSNIPFGQYGLATRNDNELIITTMDGIHLADHKKSSLHTLLNFPLCQGSALLDNEGNIFIRRYAGVGKLSDGKLTFVGGGLLHGPNLMLHPDNTVRLISYTSENDRIAKTIISTLGAELGFQKNNYIDMRPFDFNTGCYASDGELVIFGNGGTLVFSEDTRKVIRDYESRSITNPNGITRSGDYDVFVCGNDTTIFKFNTKTKEQIPILDLKINGSCHALCHSSNGDFYYWGHYQTTNQDTKGCVLRWRLPETEGSSTSESP